MKLRMIILVSLFVLPVSTKAQEGTCFILHEESLGTVQLLKVPCPESRDSIIRQGLIKIIPKLPTDGSAFYLDTIVRRWSNESIHWLLQHLVTYVREVSPPTDETRNYTGEEIKSWVINHLLADDKPFPLNTPHLRALAEQFSPESYKLIHDSLRESCYQIDSCNNNN